MDRDFVLEGRTTRPETAIALVAPDVTGWVALASFRPEMPQVGPQECRCVKIVVDCSGSMAGDSIQQARIALERILDGLHTGDVFEIIAFGTSQRTLFGREQRVSESSLARARRFVRRLDADMGGTEIGAALAAAYAVRGECELPRDLLLITDGEVWHAEELISHARKSRHRFFTVGVGSAVAEPFVRRLASETGGACEIVSPREDMAGRIHRHFQRMYAPRTVGASVIWPTKPAWSAPGKIETVYGGDTVHVFSWFAEKPEGTVGFEAALDDGRVIREEASVSLFDGGPENIRSEEASTSSLARIAVARRLAEMESSEASTELAVRYQLMSPWTDYIVVHTRADAEKTRDLPEIRKVAHVLAAGWHGMGTVDAVPAVFSEISNGLARRVPEFAAKNMEPIPDLRSDFSRTSVEGIEPVEFAKILDDQKMPPLPSLDDLERWGLPATVVALLRDLVDEGMDEAAVVTIFLHVFAQSTEGQALERHVPRPVLKAYKMLRPELALVKRVDGILEEWNVQASDPDDCRG